MLRLRPYARYGWNHIGFYVQSARNFLELKGAKIEDESPETWCFFWEIDLEEEIEKWIWTSIKRPENRTRHVDEPFDIILNFHFTMFLEILRRHTS